jgi:hypothetical protein
MLMLPRPTIEAFDLHLLGLGLRFEGVVIGGSALGLMGVIQRPTRDFDILVPELPPAIVSLLLKSKLFALCDRGTDLPDCTALAPTAEELAECVPWLELQDGNELWPAHVRATVAGLARRLGHGV